MGPIVEHNWDGDINFDLQHKDCVCGMAYYEEKGTYVQCRAINGYSLLSRVQSYRVVD